MKLKDFFKTNATKIIVSIILLLILYIGSYDVILYDCIGGEDCSPSYGLIWELAHLISFPVEQFNLLFGGLPFLIILVIGLSYIYVVSCIIDYIGLKAINFLRKKKS